MNPTFRVRAESSARAFREDVSSPELLGWVYGEAFDSRAEAEDVAEMLSVTKSDYGVPSHVRYVVEAMA